MEPKVNLDQHIAISRTIHTSHTYPTDKSQNVIIIINNHAYRHLIFITTIIVQPKNQMFEPNILNISVLPRYDYEICSPDFKNKLEAVALRLPVGG